MDVLCVKRYGNEQIKASQINVTKFASTNSISIKKATQYLGSKNTSTNDNICKTCGKNKCQGHVGTIAFINPVNHQHYPIFCPIFWSTSSVKSFMKLVCPICCNVKSPQLVEILEMADRGEMSKAKQEFKKIQKTLEKRRHKCSQPNCNSPYSSFKYNQGLFTYKLKDVVTVLDFDSVYKIFKKNMTRSMGILINDVPIDVDTLFFLYGVPITSTTARYMSTYNNTSQELFSSTYKALVEYSDKLSHATPDQIDYLQQAISKLLFSTIIKQKITYSMKPNTPSMAMHLLGNDKNSLINSSLIGGPKFPSGSAVASAISDGKLHQVHMSRDLANYFLYADCCTFVNRELIKERLKDNLYQYLIRIKKGKNDIYNLSETSKIEVQDGDMLLRYLLSGDVITITRFPTLSRFSRVAFEVVIHNDRYDMTIKVPVPDVVMFNLDFDGDKVFVNISNNPSSKVDQVAILSVNASLLNDITGGFMLGVVQENQVVLNTILRLVNIPKELAYQLMGTDIDLLEEVKEVYTGKELFSAFFPKYVTFPGLIENGNIVVERLEGKKFGANSPTSIFTLLCQCMPPHMVMTLCESLNGFGYRVAYYHGQCIRLDHVLHDHVLYLEMKADIDTIYSKYELVLDAKIKSMEASKKIINKTVFYREIQSVIDLLDNEIKARLKLFIEPFQKIPEVQNFNSDEVNYFIEYVMQKLKVKESDFMKIYAAKGSIRPPDNFPPGVNGKTGIYSLKNEFTLSSIGHSKYSHIEGDDVIGETNAVSRVASVQFQDINQKTADIGTINKKQLKLAQPIRTNHNRSLLNGDVLINPIINDLGVLPKDLVKVQLTEPNDSFVNSQLIEFYFEKLKPLLNTIDVDKGVVSKTSVSFYFHPYSFIRMYHEDANDDEEYNPAQDIIAFWKRIRYDYFFMLRPVLDLIYLTLIYFDPSHHFLKTFRPKSTQGKLSITKTLWKRCEHHIEHLLKYSITTAFNGIQCATAIQAASTQQALSAHQPISRMGNIINSNFVSDYLATLRLNAKPSDILILVSEDRETLVKILRKFRYATLNTLEVNIEFDKKQEDNIQVGKCTISISILSIAEEMMTATDVWLMLKYNLSSLEYVQSFSIDINITKTHFVADIDLHFNLSIGSFQKHMTQFEIDVKKFNKGRENNFITIEKIDDKLYKMEMGIKLFKDFKLMNTQKILWISIPLYMCKSISNLKLCSTIRNVLVSLTDPTLFFAFQTHADAQHSSRGKTLSIKPDNNKILTATTYETPLHLGECLLKGYVDKGYSIESASFKGCASKIGKTEYENVLDPFSFDQLETTTKINKYNEEDITEVF